MRTTFHSMGWIPLPIHFLVTSLASFTSPNSKSSWAVPLTKEWTAELTQARVRPVCSPMNCIVLRAGYQCIQSLCYSTSGLYQLVANYVVLVQSQHVFNDTVWYNTHIYKFTTGNPRWCDKTRHTHSMCSRIHCFAHSSQVKIQGE